MSAIAKIVLYGPESTGKTTLCQALARHYKTNWVPEFAREYLQEKWDRYKKKCDKEDLLVIAKKQIETENKFIQKANRYLFCDTNVLILRVWSEIYFNGYCHPDIISLIDSTKYDLYMLTDIDIPWERDDLRDMPHQREILYNYHKHLLDCYGFKYITLKGSHEIRLQKAVNDINAFSAGHRKNCMENND